MPLASTWSPNESFYRSLKTSKSWMEKTGSLPPFPIYFFSVNKWIVAKLRPRLRAPALASLLRAWDPMDATPSQRDSCPCPRALHFVLPSQAGRGRCAGAAFLVPARARAPPARAVHPPRARTGCWGEKERRACANTAAESMGLSPTSLVFVPSDVVCFPLKTPPALRRLSDVLPRCRATRASPSTALPPALLLRVGRQRPPAS